MPWKTQAAPAGVDVAVFPLSFSAPAGDSPIVEVGVISFMGAENSEGGGSSGTWAYTGLP